MRLSECVPLSCLELGVEDDQVWGLDLVDSCLQCLQ